MCEAKSSQEIIEDNKDKNESNLDLAKSAQEIIEDNKDKNESNLNFILGKIKTIKEINIDAPNIITNAHELSKDRIGALIENKNTKENSILIFSIQNFEKIFEIKIEQEKLISDFKARYTVRESSNEEEEEQSNVHNIKDFMELNNDDILLWSDIRIYIFIFNQVKNNYELFQTIDEYKNIEPKNEYFFGSAGRFHSFSQELYSIFELKNGKLLVSNVSGCNIYQKKNNLYIIVDNFYLKGKIIQEIKDNELIIFQNSCERRTDCVSPLRSNYEIFVINIEKKKLVKTLFEKEIYDFDNCGNHISLTILDNKYLFISYLDQLIIYNIQKNMEKIKNVKLLGDGQKTIKVLCPYINDFILFEEENYHYKLYKFKNEKLEFFCDFCELYCDIPNLFRLKCNKNLTVEFNYNQLLCREYKND